MSLFSLPNRRRFLAGAAGLSVLRGAGRNARWALLADTHIAANPADEYRGFRPSENLRKAVPQIEQMSPDGVVIDGDLARMDGQPGDYHNLKALLEPVTAKFPVAMALGNHDHREGFLTTFRDDPGERHYVKGKYILSVEAGPVRLLLLDSLAKTNFTPGLLGKTQRDWLDAHLRAAGSKPTLVFVHHTLDDRDSSLLDALWLFRILERHRAVKAVIYGHSHVYSFDTWEGIHLVNIPAVGYNFFDGAPVGWVEANLGADGGDFKLRAFAGNSADDGKLTSVSWRS